MLTLTIICCCLVSINSAAQANWIRTNPGGGGAFLSIGAGVDGTILIGSDLSGAYISKDNGQTWNVIGVIHGLTAPHVSEVAFHPEDAQLLFLGTDSGIFLSSDGGVSFAQVLPVPAGFDFAYVTDIQVAPTQRNLIYAAVHLKTTGGVYQAQLYRSLNRGSAGSWIAMGHGGLPGDQASVKHNIIKLAVDAASSERLYAVSGWIRELDETAAADDLGQLYFSSDSGASWTQMAIDKGPIMDFALHPSDPMVQYLSTYDGHDASMNGILYKSTNRGASWFPIRIGYSGVLLVKPDQPNTLRAIDPRQSFPWIEQSGAWESIDGGVNWHRKPDGFDAFNACVRFPEYVSPVCNWDSHWLTHVSDHPQAYFTSFAGYVKTIGTSFANANIVFWANNQWIFKSIDGGGTFANIFTRRRASSEDLWQSRGVDNINMLDLAISEADPNLIYLALFDMGCWRSEDGGDYWQSCNAPNYTVNSSGEGWAGTGGNVASIVADPHRRDIVWATMSPFQNGEHPTYLVRSEQAGERASWQLANTGLPTRTVMGLALDHSSNATNRTLFVTAEGQVYRSQDDGNNWSLSYHCNQGCRITAVDRFDGNFVYAGGESGLYRSIDGGDNWQRVCQSTLAFESNSGFWNFGWTGVFDIKSDPNHARWVYITAYGNGDSGGNGTPLRGLYRSQDAGNSCELLLADSYMRSVTIKPGDSAYIYATSSSALEAGEYVPDKPSSGVQYSSNGGVDWRPFNQGLVWPFAVPIQFKPDGSTILMGSPGTGIYEYSLSYPIFEDDFE